jgi:hypothetical protein
MRILDGNETSLNQRLIAAEHEPVFTDTSDCGTLSIDSDP